MNEERGFTDEQDEREAGTPSTFRPGARYSALVGLAFIGLIAVATYSATQTDEGTLLGTGAIQGEPLPEFAVPDIRGPLDADANVAQDDCEGSRNPCPADERRKPACDIEPEGAIRICDLFDRPLVLSFWFTRGANCVGVQDVVDEVSGSYRGRVNFLSLNVRDERAEVERLVSERGWEVPVGWDRDGAVSNIYRIGVCPTIALAYPGGIFASAQVVDVDLTPPELSAQIDELIAESRERARGRGEGS